MATITVGQEIIDRAIKNAVGKALEQSFEAGVLAERARVVARMRWEIETNYADDNLEAKALTAAADYIERGMPGVPAAKPEGG